MNLLYDNLLEEAGDVSPLSRWLVEAHDSKGPYLRTKCFQINRDQQ